MASLSRFVDASLRLPSLGFSFDWSRSGLARSDFELLATRGQAALDAMSRLEAGAIANPDENRRVGHYWLRAPELAPEPALREAITRTVDEVEALAAGVRSGTMKPPSAARFRHAIVVGIGGSALGPQLVIAALSRAGDGLAVHFADNTDPAGFDALLSNLAGALAETLVVVISKSGGTKETRNGMLEVANAYRDAGLDFGQHAIAITQEGSELDRYAKASGFRATLPMWDWVGGRTSVTSAVGLLPAALAGVDVRGLLAGAAEMDRATRARTMFENPAALLACAWFLLGDGHGRRAMVMLPYKDALELSSRYLQQLVMESLGKREDRAGRVVSQGLTVYGNKGSTDQHAYVQQLLDGPDDFFVVFVDVLRERRGAPFEVEPGVTSGDYLAAFLQGTRRALEARDKRSLTLTFRDVDARALGGFIALFERAVGLYAEMIDINAYHQPAVESGKRAAADVLALQARALEGLSVGADDARTAVELASALGEDDSETLYFILRRLAENGRVSAIPAEDPLLERFFKAVTG